MAKLTRSQRDQLEKIRAQLDRAVAYVRKPDVYVCRRESQATTTLHLSRPDLVLYPVDKEIGSDLCGLYFAREGIGRMLEEA